MWAMPTNRFASQVALVTGAGSGIGLATAQRLHAEGATVVLLDRNPEGVKAAAAELGGRAQAVVCDVADHAGVAAVVADVVARLGRLDVLVTAAGVDRCDTVPGTSIEEWRSIIDVDASFITGAVLPVDAGWTAA
jgi:meso-butanediol dehydrogenase / (S,S)-butanediol dehydrogenase / diacetyl reductase